MLTKASALPHLAASDIPAMKEFYHGTLGLPLVEESEGHLVLDVSGTPVLVFQHEDPQPSERTVLGLRVSDLSTTVDALIALGQRFERYEDFGQDERGVSSEGGRKAAWLKDPTGHTIALLEM